MGRPEADARGGTIYVRAPDHLGDGVLALPALEALAGLGELVIKGPRWAGELYAGLGRVVAEVPPSARMGVLFKPAFRAAWEARRLRPLVGTATDHRALLLSTRVPPAGDRTHRSEEYRALAEAAGARVPPGPWAPRLAPLGAAAAGVGRDLTARNVLLLPGSATGATVQWPRYRELADRLGPGVAIFAGGPAEAGWLSELAGPHRCLPTDLGLRELAAAAVAVGAVVANDAGLAHLATAARRGADGEPGAAGVLVVYGSTVPERTGPPGSTAIMGPRVACAPCYLKTCPTQVECLELDVGTVEAALARQLGG